MMTIGSNVVQQWRQKKSDIGDDRGIHRDVKNDTLIDRMQRFEERQSC